MIVWGIFSLNSNDLYICHKIITPLFSFYLDGIYFYVWKGRENSSIIHPF
jgi:hypothetical protein